MRPRRRIMPNTHRMKLRARDSEDLQVIAAVLQDAILPVKEMAYLPAERRFVLLFNRFKWERLPKEGPAAALEAVQRREAEQDDEDVAFAEEGGGPVFERVHSALTFDGVQAARLRGIDRKDKARLLELLTIEAKAGEIVLLFAEEAAIRLQAKKVRVHLEDMGEPWPTPNLPNHGEDEDGAAS